MNIELLLANYELAVEQAPRRVVADTAKWAADVPQEAGVYVLWKEGAPVYVGETSGLRLRLRDLTNFENHSFAKNAAREFTIATDDLVMLRQVLSQNYELSFVVVPFGRKEVEEYLILRWRSTLVNKSTSRLKKSKQYDWVQPSPRLPLVASRSGHQ